MSRTDAIQASASAPWKMEREVPHPSLLWLEVGEATVEWWLWEAQTGVETGTQRSLTIVEAMEWVKLPARQQEILSATLGAFNDIEKPDAELERHRKEAEALLRSLGAILYEVRSTVSHPRPAPAGWMPPPKDLE